MKWLFRRAKDEPLSAIPDTGGLCPQANIGRVEALLPCFPTANSLPPREALLPLLPTTKETYLAWRTAWREEYKTLSTERRLQKAAVRITAPAVDDLLSDQRGRALARAMLEQRRLSKVVIAARYQDSITRTEKEA